MKLPNVTRILVLALILLLLGNSASNAWFGRDTCKDVERQIKTREQKVVRDIQYLSGLQGNYVSIESAQGVAIYNTHTRLNRNLQRIRDLGNGNSKCFNLSVSRSFVSTSNWTADWYISLRTSLGKYVITFNSAYQRVIS